MIDQFRNKERGSLLVESALVLLAFVLIVVSVFDFGQVLFLHQSITERVRAALRYGTVNSYDGAAIQNYVIYGQPAPPASASPDFSLTPAMVSVQRAEAGTTDDRVTITVSNYPYLFLSPFIAGARAGSPVVESLPYEGNRVMETFIMYVVFFTLGLSSCVFAAKHLLEVLSRNGLIEQDKVKSGAANQNGPAGELARLPE